MIPGNSDITQPFPSQGYDIVSKINEICHSFEVEPQTPLTKEDETILKSVLNEDPDLKSAVDKTFHCFDMRTKSGQLGALADISSLLISCQSAHSEYIKRGHGQDLPNLCQNQGDSR